MQQDGISDRAGISQAYVNNVPKRLHLTTTKDIQNRVYCDVQTRCWTQNSKQTTRHEPLTCNGAITFVCNNRVTAKNDVMQPVARHLKELDYKNVN